MNKILNLIIFILFAIDHLNGFSLNDQYIHSGIRWNDTDGNSIQAHATGILIDPQDGSYWWYGESLKTSTLSDHGVNCYHSKDLLNWVNIGQVLGQQQVHVKDREGPYVIERPRVVYNSKTKLYVMWFHLDSSNYSYRCVGIATSPSPNATFTFIDGLQLGGISSLDMSLYEDKRNGIVNGVYLIRSCNNEYVVINKLTDDYLNATDITSTIGEPREAYSIFHRNNRYYMMTSHLTGWAANPADLLISDRDSLDGAKWISLGNPTGSSTTFNSQATFVLPFPSTKYPGTYFYIYMGDRWVDPDLLHASYVWLPYTFYSDTNITLEWKDQWALTDY
jgi:hypothetical protein